MNFSRIQTFFLYLIFFLSGVSALISEITWNRMLVLVVGNTVAATSMIVAAFMGGLALGSYWGGRAFSKLRPSLLPYIALEFSIGLYVLASPLFFQPLSLLFAELAPVFLGSPVLPVIRLAVTFAALFIPAFLMGATFPAIIAGAALEGERKGGARTGYLYGINTLGAALGCLVAGYFLLPLFGARLSLAWAFSLNMIAAASGIWLNAHAKKSREIPAAPTPVVGSETGHGGTAMFNRSFNLLIVFSTFAAGFMALSYQVVLTRLVILFFGNQLIVFTLVLTAFLLGTGISAVLGTWLHGLTSRPRHLFSFMSIAAGASLVAPPFLLMALSTAQSGWLADHRDALVVVIMLVPTFLIGGLLPIAIRLLQSGLRPDAIVNAGKLYAVNSLGGMLGAATTNYFLIPLLGTQGILSSFAAIFTVIGVSLLWYLKRSIRGWSAVAASALLAGIFFLSLPHKLDLLYTGKLTEYSGGDIDPRLQLHKEGRVATVTVIDFPYLGFRDMFLNGVEEASTRFSHVQLFKLLGTLPILAHESDAPQEAMVIAFGAGITAGSVLGTGRVSSLDVVDLNPDIEGINALFKEVNGDVYHNPAFNFIVEDGRNHLLANRKKYPVIISDATHPRAYDSWILYTEEFYLNVKERLTPDGVFVQWVPLSDFSLEMYQILLNTFTKVFPNSTLWSIYGTDQAFLLATPKPLALDFQQLQQRLDSMPPALQLKEYQLSKATDIAGFFLMDPAAIAKFVGDEKRINTDDLPYNQKYSLKKTTSLWTQSFDQYQADILPYLKGVDDAGRTAIFDRQVLARAMQRYFFFQDPAALDDALAISPVDGNVLYYRELESRQREMSREMFRKDAAKIRERIELLKDEIEKSPGKAEDQLDLASLYMKLNLAGSAEQPAREAMNHAPDSVPAHEMMGRIHAALGNRREAEKMYEYVLAHEPQNKAALESLIRLYAEQREFKKAIGLLRNMETDDDGHRGATPRIYQHYMNLAGAYFSLGDYDNAEKFLLESLAVYPGNTSARLYLAGIYLRNERVEAAISQLEQALKINPYHESARSQLASQLRDSGKDEKAKVPEAIRHKIPENQAR